MSKSVLELQAQLEIAIEAHERARSPYYDQDDLKGWLTHRKNELRRQIKAAKRQEQDA